MDIDSIHDVLREVVSENLVVVRLIHEMSVETDEKVGPVPVSGDDRFGCSPDNRPTLQKHGMG